MKKIICIMLAVLLLVGCGVPAESTGAQTQATENGKLRARILEEEVVFEPWEQEGLPLEGCYFLTGDVVLTAPVTVSGQMKLHLNGHTISGEHGVQYGSLFTVPAGGELVIYDEPEGTGAVISPRSYSVTPYTMHTILVGGTVTIAGGTVDASAINLEDVANGAGFYVQSGGVLNVTGGTVIGGTVWSTTSTEQTKTAEEPTEGEETEQTEEAEPVEVLGKGGSVYVEAGGVCNLSGGTVTGGSAGLGGNLYIAEEGLLTLSGGVVTEGEAVFHGGNGYVAGEMRISGGEISLGESYSNGGNLFVCGTLEMTGGVIREGKCCSTGRSGKRGGNILVNGENAVVHISNAQLLDGDAYSSENFGGNLSVIGYCARELTVTDTVISGGKGHRGGNVYIGTLSEDVAEENLDFTFVNVTMTEGMTSYRGANLCLDSDYADKTIVLNMENCELLLETGASMDNIAVGAGAANVTYCVVNMVGGSVSGGLLNIYGTAVVNTTGTDLSGASRAGTGELITD